MPHVIVSYDGTRNDRDALALGRLFANAGCEISLAYVRHASEPDAQHEASAQRDVEHLLAVGAGLLEGIAVGQHVIVNSSTAEGLAELAVEVGAEVIAFGSSYRTPFSRVELPHTAEQLLDRGIACSLALAPAGLRREPVERSIGTISVYDEDKDPVALASAKSLGHALGAIVTADEADLLVITSRAQAPSGRLLLSGTAREQIEQARCPALALARGAALSFG
jgi:nucleotide-binding universal stress UspA family protein